MQSHGDGERMLELARIGPAEGFDAMRNRDGCGRRLPGRLDRVRTQAEQSEGAVAHELVEMAAGLLALGLDPERCTLFVQSHRPEHTELMWLLSTVTPVSWLERTPTYKDKIANQPDDARKRAFLLDSEGAVFVATEGDVFSQRYKIVRIGVNSIVIEDLQFNDQQTLPLDESGKG